MTSIIDRILTWQGSITPGDAFNFCDLICQTYEKADSDLRAEIRKAVAANEKVEDSLLYNSLDSVGHDPADTRRTTQE